MTMRIIANKKMIKAISFIIAIALSGCAQEMLWSHASKGSQEFYADRAQCSAMAGNGQQNQVFAPQQPVDGFASGFANGLNLGNAMNTSNSRGQIFDDCMMGNGWFLVPAN